jgi:hypothetical protein
LASNSFDIIIIVETWLGDHQNLNLKHEGYKALHSTHTDRRGVCILFRSTFSADEIFPEFSNGELLIVKINCKPENLIVAGLYTPPSHSDHARSLRNFSIALQHLKDRFSLFSLVVFTDFNRDFRKAHQSRSLETLTRAGLQVHIDHAENSYTREQKVSGELLQSYLDYFLTCNAHAGQLRLGRKMGGSDHRLVAIEISRTSPVIALRKSRINYKCIRQRSSGVADCILQMRCGTPATILRDLSHLLEAQQKGCPKFYSKPKSLVRTFDIVEAELAKEIPDKEKVEKMLRVCIRTDFNNFLDLIQRLRINGEMKEYYLKIGFLLKKQSHNPFINQLRHPDSMEEIITDPDIIDATISEKYSETFSNFGDKKSYDTGGPLPFFSRAQVYHALQRMSRGKAISHDLIPDDILSNKEDEDFILGMTKLINTLMMMRFLPPQIMTGRLLCFNKDPSNVPSLENIRPINIQSVLLKIIESLLLSELQEFIRSNNLLHTSQIGFREHLSTNMNLIRFVEATSDIRAAGSRDGFVLFIDLKAAFDSVSHEILFRKLESLGLREDLLNLIKFIYSLAFTKLSEDSHAIPINRGVVQGL